MKQVIEQLICGVSNLVQGVTIVNRGAQERKLGALQWLACQDYGSALPAPTDHHATCQNRNSTVHPSSPEFCSPLDARS
jgi:hypothetical protein